MEKRRMCVRLFSLLLICMYLPFCALAEFSEDSLDASVLTMEVEAALQTAMAAELSAVETSEASPEPTAEIETTPEPAEATTPSDASALPESTAETETTPEPAETTTPSDASASPESTAETETTPESAETTTPSDASASPEPIAEIETTPEPAETTTPSDGDWESSILTGSGSGSFFVMAYTEDQVLIAPMAANYSVSDTVAHALEQLNGHSVVLSEGKVARVDGVDGDYRLYGADGECDAARYASECDMLVIVNGDAPSNEKRVLICSLAACADSARFAQDAALAALYAQIVEDYLSLSDEDAALCAQRLDAAMQGETVPVGDANAPEQREGVYQIRTGGELQWFAEQAAQQPSVCAALCCDVSLEGLDWTPIGSADAPYVGAFDGGGYTISGLSISATGDDQALFGYVGEGAQIANFTVSGSVDAGGSYTAGIVAYSEASLSNLHNMCKVTSSGQYVGGVVGAFANASCTATNCSNSGTIYAANAVYAGGVLGGKSGKLVDCQNSGAVTGNSSVGGVAGQATELTNCENVGDVQGESSYVGGAAGRASKLKGCVNRGMIRVSGVYIEVRARYEAEYIGGVAGYAATVQECANHGSILAREEENVYFFSAAGVAGKASKAEDCSNDGEVTVPGNYIAGVVGGNGGGSVVRCFNTAAVTNAAAKGEQTGGVASAGKLTQCYNLGDVSGGHYVGGVAGGTTNTTLQSCYNLGKVTGRNHVGGVVGVCLSIADCYSAGAVKVRENVGGMVAGDASGAEACYYLNASDLYSKVGVPLDREALRLCMQNAADYRLNLNQNVHEGYPQLNFEAVGATETVQRVALKAGDKEEYFVVCGGTIAGLPKQVVVCAGGLEFECDAEWNAAENFDAATPGRYAFSANPKLPAGCALDAQTQVQEITVVVCAEEELPLVTAVRLDGEASAEYAAVYGREPNGLPEFVWATIDGEERKIAAEWIAPEHLDLTNTEEAFLYTMRFCESVRIADGVELPALCVRVLPLTLVGELRFTEKMTAQSRQFDLHYDGAQTVDGVQTFYYTLDFFDGTRSVYLCAAADEAYADGLSMQMSYTMLNAGGYDNRVSLKPGKTVSLPGYAPTAKKFAAENTAVLQAQYTNEETGETIVQHYVVSTRIQPTLEQVSATAGGAEAYITPVFDGEWLDYRVQITAGVQEVQLRLAATLDADQMGGVSVSIDGVQAQRGEDGIYTGSIAVQGEETPFEVCLRAGTGAETRYQFCLVRLQETRLSVDFTPSETKFSLSNAQTGAVFADDDGSYRLIRGFEYEYSASAYGYVSLSGSFVAEEAQMQLKLELQAAPSNDSVREDMESQWNGFRGDETNNAVSSSSTPISASDAVLYWANQAGIAYGSDAVSSPILVDGDLICTAKQNIFKIDTVTGEIVQVGDMIKKSSFNITPPTYAKGMIFVALADGVVQAFNADTLESLWVYTDALGGQPNSPITYRNGYIYTGFWNGETDDGNWVCLSITDENPNKANEAKAATWTYTQRGGFYWAGAYVQDRFMIVGTDDGVTGYTSASSNLLSLDPNTGRLIDCLSGLEADIRSTICYDETTNRYYFTSKGGYFYSVAVTEDGYFRRDSLKKLDLRGGRDVEGMSTSTPVVYNGRAYVGVSGSAQFKPYSGHGIAVIDLNAWEIAYLCPTRGYPQSSGLLTNAYENTGLVYVYFFDNMTPGSLRVIRDCPGQTQMLSIYDGSPIDEAEILFTPRGAQRQYALCSPIVDEYGTFYFKNDSGYMMALGSRVVSLEVTEMPNKRLYEEGECFDATGMRVVQHLANGSVRDVTQSVSWSQEPLTAQDTDITIYFDYVRYNNDAEVLDRPQVAVNLTVLSHDSMAAVRAVAEGIANLGATTLESGETIRALRAAYDALTAAQQECISNYEALTRAEEEYQLLERAEKSAAQRAVRLIDAIGEVDLESAQTLRSAFELYNSLSAFGKALVSNYDLLLEKQAQYSELLKAGDAEAYALMQEIAQLGEITLESGSTLYALRDRFDRLPEASKQRVSNLSVLEAAEARYAQLVEQSQANARRVMEMIEAIGQVNLEQKSAILRAREAYDALDEAEKADVDNYEKLLEAEEALKLLEDELENLSAVTAELDALAAQMTAIAPQEEDVNAENAAQLAPLIDQMTARVQAQENQSLFSAYSRMTDVYRIAIAACVHEDAATGVWATGLEWYQQLKVQPLTSGKDAAYSQFKSLVAPQRVIKLYRVSVIDLIHGTQDANHASLELHWTIPVPKYNDSAYSAIGVAHVGEAAAAQHLESSYADHNRSLKFATRGDGLIGVVGTKIEMTVDGSVSASGSVLDGIQSGSQKPNSSNGASHAGSAQSSGRIQYSDAQSALLSSQENLLDTDEWTYRDAVIFPALLAKLSDAQVNLYREMSRAVENGSNRFFGYAVSMEEFEQVYQAYRQSNPLSVLVEMEYTLENGMVEVEYVLPEEDHLDAIANWHAQVARLVNYCRIADDVELTAARLYQQLAQTTILAAAQWQPEEADTMAEFWPSPYYALMNGRAFENDAASLYAYLLMQCGVECALVRQAEGEHCWVVLWQGWLYTHADLEMDLYCEDAPEEAVDALAHFGMGESRRAESLDAPGEYEMLIPETMQPSPEDAPQTEAFAVPECADALSGYVPAQAEPEEEVVVEVLK